jgi:acetyl-CoA decarbonylase/synthase complex subunit gamma
MKLAAKKAELSECPYASDEAKRVLGAASEPPVREIGLGAEKNLKLGAETVLYRHEKTFVHQTALAVNINDSDAPAARAKALAAIRDYSLVRVGETLIVDMVAITQKGSDGAAFAGVAKEAWETVKRPLVLIGKDVDALRAAAAAVKGSGSVLVAPTAAASEALVEVAKENGHALAVTAPDLDGIVALTANIKLKGFNDLILNFQTFSMAEQLQTNSIARRTALKDNYKPLGYPCLHVVTNENFLEGSVEAMVEICRYGGICVLPQLDPAQISALMTLRMNIYTDPQKPIQVEPKVYPIGEPKADSPVFVTTNFSLTYFIVSGEIENSGTSAWLVVPECEGMSVLTAWAAGKFSGASIGKFMKESGIEKQVTTRQVVIPGYVAQISGELEESLPGWKVLVGPQEAGDIESFVKAKFAK